MSHILIKTEEDYVYLEDDSTFLGGINLRELNTTHKNIISAYNKITKKFNLSQEDIKKIIQFMLTNRRIEGFGREILRFCYHCKRIMDNEGEGILNLVNCLKRRKSYDKILHHFFVTEIGFNYAEDYKIKLNIKKKEKGVDINIDNFKCECKTRERKDFNFKENEKKSLNKLAQNELNKSIRNRIIGAFFKQGAEIVFIDSSLTDLGLFQVSKNIFKKKILNSPPKLKRYMVVFYSRIDKYQQWTTIFIPPK